jgi:hypothetical protein
MGTGFRLREVLGEGVAEADSGPVSDLLSDLAPTHLIGCVSALVLYTDLVG